MTQRGNKDKTVEKNGPKKEKINRDYDKYNVSL